MELNHHRGGSGEPLVLIHGIGSRWQVWEPVLERLEAQREVIALDLPGFGGSPRAPAGTPAGPPSLARLVAEFLDRHGLEQPHVAGNSLGGWLALELARMGRARTAAALSPAGFHNRLEGAYLRASLWSTVRLARALAGQADTAMATARRRRLLLAQLVSRAERIPAGDAADTIRALAGAAWFDDTLPTIINRRFYGGEEIAVPVTIGWGEHDRLLVRRQGARALRQIPTASLVLLRGCGHVPTYDDPDQVAAVLLAASAAG